MKFGVPIATGSVCRVVGKHAAKPQKEGTRIKILRDKRVISFLIWRRVARGDLQPRAHPISAYDTNLYEVRPLSPVQTG
jgi:hypothetical protein